MSRQETLETTQYNKIDSKNINALFRLYFRIEQSTFLIALVAFFLYCAGMTLLFPFFQNLEGIGSLLNNPFIRLFLPKEATEYLSFKGFITLQVISSFTIAYALVTMYLATTFAGDIENGNVELLLSHTVQRKTLVLVHWIFSELFLFIFILPSIFGIFVASFILNLTINSIRIFQAFLGLFIMYSAFMSIGHLIGVILFRRKDSLVVIVVVYFLFRFLEFLGRFADQPINLISFFSVFSYYQASDIIFDNYIWWLGLVVLLVVTLSTVLASIYLFERKDIP